jgi:hypothetical protein
MVSNKVVIRFKDNRVLKGTTSNFFPNKDRFHLEQQNGQRIEVRVEDLKAIFFVKDFDGNKDHKDNYGDKVAGGGRRISVKFADGETIVGYTLGYSVDRPGFYLSPSDLKANNERIFVVKSAAQKIEML